MHLYAFGHNEAVYGPTAGQFLPERFLPAAQDKQRAAPEPLSFSAGPRDCAGQALARLEIAAIIATMVGRFQISLAPEAGGWEGALARRAFFSALFQAGGIPLTLTPRAAAAPAAAVVAAEAA